MIHTLSAPTIEYGKCRVSLSKNLVSGACKDVRSSVAKKLGPLNVDPTNPERSRGDAFGLYLEAKEAVDFARSALASLRREIANHQSILAALKSGKLPVGPSPEAICASEAYHTCMALQKHHPDAALVDLLADTIATHETTYDEMVEAEQIAQGRFDKARETVRKAACSAFCFHANVAGLIAQAVDKDLPTNWQAYIRPDRAYGQASFDPFDPLDENLAASSLQVRFRRMLEVEMNARKESRARAKRTLDEGAIRAKLRR